MRYFALLIFIFLIGCETTKSVTKSTKVSVNEIIENRKIEKNFTKKQLKDALGLRYMFDNPFTQAGKSHRVLEHDAEIISGANQNIFYVFKYVSEPLECGFFGCNLGNGALVSWHSNFEDALNSLGEKELTQTEKLNQKVTKSTSSNNKILSSSKSLGGPRENAERVAALKFYKIECGKLSYDGNVMLNEQERNMDQGVYRATQRKLSDAVLYEGIDRTCNMLYGVLNPQGLTK